MQKLISVTVILAFIIVFASTFAYSQSEKTSLPKRSKIEKLSTWDIQKTDKGYLMFLDVPYKSGDSLQYMTLTVAKNYHIKRPDFISIIIPPIINKSVSIIFDKTIPKGGKRETEIDNDGYVYLPIEGCNAKYCSIRMYNGMAKHRETNNEIDVFAKFMSFGHLYVSFTDSNRVEKIPVSLLSFQQQYNALLAANVARSIKKKAYTDIQLTPEEETDDTTLTPWEYAGFTHPNEFKKFLKYLKYLVQNNKKKEVAQFLYYPTNYCSDSLMQTPRVKKSIDDEEYFLSNYDAIFNNIIKSALINQPLNHIFRRNQGAMIGNRGELWFRETDDGEFKIVTINNGIH